MQPDKKDSHHAARLLPSLLLFAASLIVAYLFGSSIQAPSERGAGPDGTDAHDQHAKPHSPATHEQAHAQEQVPVHYTGGLWSRQLGLGGLSELAVLATSPQSNLVCQSISWDETSQKLVVIDVSPLRTSQRTSVGQGKSRAVLSVDYRGGEVPAEFGSAIQEHIKSLSDADKIIVLTPLPGPASLSTVAIPYDWTYLENADIIDWIEVEPLADLPGRPQSGYLLAWVKQAAPDYKPDDNKPVAELFMDLDVIADRTMAARQMLVIAHRSPYEVVPTMRKWLNPDKRSRRSNLDPFRPDALNLMRAMGIHADDMIDQAAASEDPLMRVLAARAIGDLAEVTTDPLGKLTPLAEDKVQAVRYEALVACRAKPGRRAAGIAQLVEPYAMSDNMRQVYAGTMAELLTYGPPVPADSRADRLRRMPIDELLAEERDALVCTILLSRTDLPDDKITEVLTALAQANGQGPLTALLNLLETMNPRTLTDRLVLIRTLAGWKTNELEAQQQRLVELIQQAGRPQELKAAAAGGLMRAARDPDAVQQRLGDDPIVFAGLAWIEDGSVIKAWSPITVSTATSTGDGSTRSQIAALDALSQLPAEDVKPAVPQLLGVARQAQGVELRFAAIRAINALPESIKPDGIDDLELTSLTLTAVPGQIRYDKTQLTAIAGRPVEITLVNPDNMEHNLVVTLPGRMQEVGSVVSSMPPAEAAAIGFIPDSEAVLYHTPMLRPGQTATLRFIAPTKPGKYPYVCTFPGHYTSMNGVMDVIEP